MWLGVHVKRELNVDCDRLSHPHLAEEVIGEARAAGLFVHRIREYEGVWDPIRAAVAAQSPARRARKRRVRDSDSTHTPPATAATT